MRITTSLFAVALLVSACGDGTQPNDPTPLCPTQLPPNVAYQDAVCPVGWMAVCPDELLHEPVCLPKYSDRRDPVTGVCPPEFAVERSCLGFDGIDAHCGNISIATFGLHLTPICVPAGD